MGINLLLNCFGGFCFWMFDVWKLQVFFFYASQFLSLLSDWAKVRTISSVSGWMFIKENDRTLIQKHNWLAWSTLIVTHMYKSISVGLQWLELKKVSAKSVTHPDFVHVVSLFKSQFVLQFVFWFQNTYHSLHWDGFLQENCFGCTGPTTNVFSLYNAATFRPSCGDIVWSSGACSTAEKHIPGVYADCPVRLMLTDV